MALFGSDKPQQSGMEMMLRSMGLSNILDMAQAMASDGTLERIMKFADELERHNSLLEEVRDELRAIRGNEQLSGPSIENLSIEELENCLRPSAYDTAPCINPRDPGEPLAYPEPEDAASGTSGPD